ncbi:carbohydrate-binding protein [Streptomyces sp. NPDC050534]|uniref:carbohydrate-binding protein n=1 Tax=Streptomyces sp. NPDC050534 TaxID=3365625 RepID=UPI0037AFF319
MDLSGAARFEAEVGRAAAGPGQVRLEVWAGDRLLAQVAVPVTGDRYPWSTVAAGTTAQVGGVHELRLTLHGGFRLASFRFAPAADDRRGGAAARR